MTTETAQLFFSLLTIAAASGAIAWIGVWVAARRGHSAAVRLGAALGDAAVWLAFLVAATCMLGSLYFSEVADFVPCRLCWFQRIAMYPLSAVLLVGALRRDPGVDSRTGSGYPAESIQDSPAGGPETSRPGGIDPSLS